MAPAGRFVLTSVPSLDKRLIDFTEVLFIHEALSFAAPFLDSSAPYNPDCGCAASAFVSIFTRAFSLFLSLERVSPKHTLVSRYEH